MPSFPNPITDVFEIANQTLKTAGGIVGLDNTTTTLPGFASSTIPSTSSNPAARLLPANRPAVFARNLIQWFVPEMGVVEMYVNPQNISYNYKKSITSQRTKGGYVLQYWGEELTPLTISGTTGSSGIEGINVLYDIYRAEQIAFDPYALALASDRDSKNNDQLSFLGDGGGLNSLLGNFSDNFSNLVSNAIETGSSASTRAQPSLASLAFSVEMFYSGWVFRGYFTDFRLEERAEKLGLFDYTMTFMVTQRRGVRSNFLGWHRQPDGPSNSDPAFGRPYSFSGLSSERVPVRRPNEDKGLSAGDILDVFDPIVGALSGGFSSIF